MVKWLTYCKVCHVLYVGGLIEINSAGLYAGLKGVNNML